MELDIGGLGGINSRIRKVLAWPRLKQSFGTNMLSVSEVDSYCSVGI